MKENLPKCPDTGILILRLSLGLMMLSHGIAKLMGGVDFIGGMFANMGLPAFLAYAVYLGEVVAPIMAIIGWRTRIAALLMVATMIVAIGLVHMGDLFSLSQSGGWALELQGFYLFTALSLFFLGAGKYAVSTKNKWD